MFFYVAPLPNQLRQNSSVENFWMLVNMGDLPQPDNDVLSETLWPTSSQSRTEQGDDSTIKSLHSQNSHGSKKRHFAESSNHSSTTIYTNLSNQDSIKLDNGRKSLSGNGINDSNSKIKRSQQVAFKNEDIVNQLPFSTINQTIPFNNGSLPESRDAIFSSQLQNIYFPHNNNETSKVMDT